MFTAASIAAGLLMSPRAAARRHLAEGNRLAQRGAAESALAEWREAVRLNPEDADAWRQIGRRHASLEQWSEAIDAFGRAARAQPDQPRIYTRLADCAVRMGDPVAAKTYVLKALDWNPQDIAALDIAQELWTASGEEPQRIQFVRGYLRQDPENEPHLMLLAELLVRELEYAEAEPVLDKIVSRNPANGRALALRGFTRLVRSASAAEVAGAEADIRRALALNANDFFAHFQLARIYRRQNRFKDAVKELETAVRLAPNQYNLHYELAAAYSLAGEAGRAAKARSRFESLRRDVDRSILLEKRCVAYPTNLEVHLEYGLLLTRLGDLPKAEYALQKAREIRRDDPRVLTALARLEQNSVAARPGP